MDESTIIPRAATNPLRLIRLNEIFETCIPRKVKRRESGMEIPIISVALESIKNKKIIIIAMMTPIMPLWITVLRDAIVVRE